MRDFVKFSIGFACLMEELGISFVQRLTSIIDLEALVSL